MGVGDCFVFPFRVLMDMGWGTLGQRVIGDCLSSKAVCFDCLNLASMARPEKHGIHPSGYL